MDKTSNLCKKQRMKSSIMAGVLSCSLLSGCGIKTASDNEALRLSKSNNEYSTVDNSYYPKRVIDSDNNHSFMELIYRASLYVDADKVDNLRWLNYCISLKELTISTSNTELLGQIKYLPNLESLTIINPEKDYTKSLLYDNCKFIIRANKLKKMHINNFNVETGIVEGIKEYVRRK